MYVLKLIKSKHTKFNPINITNNINNIIYVPRFSVIFSQFDIILITPKYIVNIKNINPIPSYPKSIFNTFTTLKYP
ncbi:hypothetical protein DAPK24_040540 (mitochondrion) [Pichia kluyveri]|uniref:Uncharacterized protein n=1 Tax=Pichia kluyveri TaxID=36015 RepID=A0AAV5RBT9_PICKL|nr:hypothetical protein DAPK24_040540 [Pichia kluyveri]